MSVKSKNVYPKYLTPLLVFDLAIKEGGVSEHASIEDLLEHQVSSKICHGSWNQYVLTGKVEELTRSKTWSNFKDLIACDCCSIHGGGCGQSCRHFWVCCKLDWPATEIVGVSFFFFKKLWFLIEGSSWLLLTTLWSYLVKGLAIGSFLMPIASPIWNFPL